MTNREHYAKEILDVACTGSSLAVTKSGKLLGCNECKCADCAFDSPDMNCYNRCKEWCNSEYVESEVDWSKVSVDTPIYIVQHLKYQKDINIPRHFARYDEKLELIHYYVDGQTSFTTSRTVCAIKNIVKLARPEDIEKYTK